jgi:hypothetical protein
MQLARVPVLNRIAASGLGLSVAILGYAGFLHLFGSGFLAALTGAMTGGFVMGRLMRAR